MYFVSHAQAYISQFLVEVRRDTPADRRLLQQFGRSLTYHITSHAFTTIFQGVIAALMLGITTLEQISLFDGLDSSRMFGELCFGISFVAFMVTVLETTLIVGTLVGGKYLYFETIVYAQRHTPHTCTPLHSQAYIFDAEKMLCFLAKFNTFLGLPSFFLVLGCVSSGIGFCIVTANVFQHSHVKVATVLMIVVALIGVMLRYFKLRSFVSANKNK